MRKLNRFGILDCGFWIAGKLAASNQNSLKEKRKSLKVYFQALSLFPGSLELYFAQYELAWKSFSKGNYEKHIPLDKAGFNFGRSQTNHEEKTNLILKNNENEWEAIW